MFAVVVVVFVAAVALLLLTMISHLLFIQPKTRKELQAECLSYNLKNSNGLKNAQDHQKSWAPFLAHMTNFHIRCKTGLPPLAFDLFHVTDTEEAEPIRKQNSKKIWVTVVNKKGKKRVTYKAEVGVESRTSAVKLLEDYLE